MINAVGEPQSLLVLGGASEIGVATAVRLARGPLRKVILAGRPSNLLDEAVAQVRAAGAEDVSTLRFDARETTSHEEIVDKAFAEGDIDVVLLAFGVLGDQEEAEREPATAVDVVEVNFVGAVSVCLHVAKHLRAQGHGALVVLSSVAGERARRANFVYGASKAGLDAFSQGLGDALHGSGVRVLVVRPGFVRTRMTAGRQEAPLAVTADEVGVAIAAGLSSKAHTIWVPSRLRFVMAIARHLPRPVFRRLRG